MTNTPFQIIFYPKGKYDHSVKLQPVIARCSSCRRTIFYQQIVEGQDQTMHCFRCQAILKPDDLITTCLVRMVP